MDEKSFSHFGPDGAARMVDVGEKPVSRRSAVAQAAVLMKSETAAAIRGGTAAKGDVLQVARLAGIQAAKLTSQLIPLCHIVPLDKVDVAFQWADAVTLMVIASTSATAKTGVEMEALTAASVAALTVYDMCKAIDQTMEIQSVVLIEKSGGTKGDFRRSVEA